MNAPYELRTTHYEGPLEKLLELIEARELAITEISLAEVTDDFLKYLEALRAAATEGEGEDAEARLRILADFIVIASRLIFIKSKALLPDLTLTGDEESDVRDLEARLALYRDLKPTMKHIAALWSGGRRLYVRPYLLNTASFVRGGASYKVFYPPPALSSGTLREALGRLLELAARAAMERETVRDEVISLEAKMKEVIAHITEAIETRFSRLASERTRAEIIVTFLALLHLAREQLVTLEQESHFSDIIVKKPVPSVREGGSPDSGDPVLDA